MSLPGCSRRSCARSERVPHWPHRAYPASFSRCVPQRVSKKSSNADDRKSMRQNGDIDHRLKGTSIPSKLLADVLDQTCVYEIANNTSDERLRIPSRMEQQPLATLVRFFGTKGDDLQISNLFAICCDRRTRQGDSSQDDNSTIHLRGLAITPSDFFSNIARLFCWLLAIQPIW